MDGLARFVAVVDAANEWLGRLVAWLALGCVLVCFAVVVLRYAFGIGYTWLQELYIWQHALLFMVGAGYTLLHGGHVRVDIFYRGASRRRRAWIDLFGVFAFLLPWIGLVAVESVPFVAGSWSIGEGSPQPGGLPALWLLKGALLAFCVVVALQGLALAARSVLVLAGRPLPEPDPLEQPA
jgi:TRAP-type mannitol/chloroaromatic compound transport system permease small subunit